MVSKIGASVNYLKGNWFDKFSGDMQQRIGNTEEDLMRRTANAQFIGSLQATLPTRLNGDDDDDDDDDDKNVLYSSGRSGILKRGGYFVGGGCGLFVSADFEG